MGRTGRAIRNVALIGHGGTGKTSLAEAVLYRTGATPRLGRVDDGTSILDHDPDAQRRRTTLSASLAPCLFGGCRLNLIDTPGYLDFAGDVHCALRVADAAVFVLDGAAGVEVGTRVYWQAADRRSLPRFVFVNRMDREHADFTSALDSLRSAFGDGFLPITWPLGAHAAFQGVAEVLSGRFLAPSNGRREEERPAPPGLPDLAGWRQKATEAAAESDDALLEKYLEGGELSAEEVTRGLARAVRDARVTPVLCGSALAGSGLDALLRALVELAPAPDEQDDAPFSGLVFKTVADPYVGKVSLIRIYSGVLRGDSHVRNAYRDVDERVGPLFRLRGKDQEPIEEGVAGDIVAVAKLAHTLTGDTLCDASAPVVLPGVELPRPVYPVAVSPKSKGDEDKIGAGLVRLREEDPTFTVERDAAMHQTILSAMGEMHVDVVCERLRRKFGVEVETASPRIPYRETVARPAKGEGRHKKQTGGHGQFGHCILQVEPRERGAGFEFEERIFGGSVPRQYIPAVEKGVVETMREGVLAGFPVVDVKVILLDGSYHPVDSSELAFKIAASLAFKRAFAEARPVLLEPVLELDILVPEEAMGDVMSDLNRKRGRIIGVESQSGFQRVTAHVPQAEAGRYAIDLRSITQGRGTFSARFSHYEEAPPQVVQAVVATAS